MAIPESSAIPYEPNDLRGERLLVLAPHPDDEVIGCGGLIALHMQERRAVHVAIISDGAEAGDAAVREAESRKGLSLVGGAAVEFLGFRDRQLDTDRDSLQHRLRALLYEFKPDLIAAPSPTEIHPDHVAVARALCELVQNDPAVFADFAVARVAFYEVSAPMRPNALVDISPVATKKFDAIGAHESQRAFRNYRAYAEGLNAYRSMTLPPEVQFAEAYWVTPLPSLRTTAFSALRGEVGAPKPLEVTAEPVPISVVVRTRNRPTFLGQAVDSIRGGGYPAEIVIVNDGGEKPAIPDATIINNDSAKGRSEAMNAGVRAAKSRFIAFLDDDDLYYPEHLPTLAAAATAAQSAAWYTDAVSAFVRPAANGDYETYSRMRIFAQDFDADELLLDNYIPLTTLLVARESFQALGGFDPAFDLFEDWDFLLRLSERGAFTHIPRVTCEVRHIEGAGSITMQSPEGSQHFRDAKLQIWRKHAARIDNDLIADVFERQKRRLLHLRHENVEVRGERDHLRVDMARMLREKDQLLEEFGALQARLAHLDGANAELRNSLAAADAERHEKRVRFNDSQKVVADLTAAYQETQRTNAALYAEVARLQTLLDMIYQSRTWKLHNMVEKMKGRS